MTRRQKKVLKGSYLLFVGLSNESTIGIGALGAWKFRPGTYIYCGSAMNGVRSRVGRHFRKEKRLRWHIDYLLQGSEPYGALIFPEGSNTECQLCSALSKLSFMDIPVKRFGSSDCSCPGHLLYLEDESRLEALVLALRENLIICS
jgi:sugar fermentation stimulation protein A